MTSQSLRYRFTFFQRQFLSHLILTLLVLVLLSLGFTYFIKQHIYDAKTDELNSASKVIIRLLIQEDKPELSLQAFRAILGERKISFIALDPKGEILFRDHGVMAQPLRSKGLINNLKAQIPTIKDGESFTIQKNTADPLMVFPRTTMSDGQEFYVFVVAPVQGINQTLQYMYKAILLSAVAVFFLAMMVSWLISRNMSLSINELRKATKLISKGDYTVHSSIHRSDELGELAVDFNTMAQKLEAASLKLITYEERRRMFITDVTHELRTPLTSIRGIIEGFQSGLIIDEEDRNKYYVIIEKETYRLVRLINELLDMERIQNGLITLNKGHHSLRELLEVVTESLDFLTEGKDLHIELVCAEGIHIYGDYDRLTQIFINLVKNSLQFTSTGTIRLHGSEAASETLFTITDTGKGMSPEETEQIWDRFYKADPSRSKDRSETGLGMSIVKQLVEAHEGFIEVESIAGVGTTFKLGFPRR